MTDHAVGRFECQYDTPPPDLQAQRLQSHNRRQRIGCEDKVWAAWVTFDSRADSHVEEAGIRPQAERKKTGSAAAPYVAFPAEQRAFGITTRPFRGEAAQAEAV